MWKFLHRLSTLKYYYEWSGKWVPWLLGLTAVLMFVGLYWGLLVAPADYQQGESYRIIYVHVPAAWMSMFVYVVMAGAGFIAIVWQTKLSEIVVSECAVIGAMFTALALVTGMLWGKPTWGTYWQWDARMTSELILLFLYFGIIAVHSVIEEPRTAARVASILAIIGIINIPIIHYSVTWWSSLHQPNMKLISKTPSVHPSMLYPLLIMATAFQFYFVSLLLIRMRNAILYRERLTNWVKNSLTRD